MLGRVAVTFSDENQRNLTATLKNARAASDHLPSISTNVDETLKEARGTMRRISDAVGRADGTIANLEKITKPLAERSDSIVKNLDESSAKFNKLLTDVQSLLHGLGDGDGTLRKFINDPSLYNHLDEAACDIVKMMPELQRILRDMEVFADKLARHPELIGVGGTVRPSSGLKESPTSTLPWSKP